MKLPARTNPLAALRCRGLPAPAARANRNSRSCTRRGTTTTWRALTLAAQDFFFEEDFLLDDFLLADFFFGTLPPAARASDSPIAIACFLLVTFLPEPLFNVPRLRSCIAFSTFSDAFAPYLATVFLRKRFQGIDDKQRSFAALLSARDQ